MKSSWIHEIGRVGVAVAGGLLLASALAAPVSDALTAVRYVLTIDGQTVATFTDLVGIKSEGALPLSSGDPIPNQVRSGVVEASVTLRRPMNNDLAMWSWHETVLLGDVAAARKSASLVMYNTNGQPVARYHLEHAWPSKLEIGALKAGASEVLMETVTMTCEHIQRVAP